MSHPLSPGHGDRREVALGSAIILRNCSFHLRVSRDEQRDCRTLMRKQAFKWRGAVIRYR